MITQLCKIIIIIIIYNDNTYNNIQWDFYSNESICL